MAKIMLIQVLNSCFRLEGHIFFALPHKIYLDARFYHQNRQLIISIKQLETYNSRNICLKMHFDGATTKKRKCATILKVTLPHKIYLDARFYHQNRQLIISIKQLETYNSRNICLKMHFDGATTKKRKCATILKVTLPHKIYLDARFYRRFLQRAISCLQLDEEMLCKLHPHSCEL